MPAPLDVGPLLDAVRGVTWPSRIRVRAGMPGVHRAAQRGTTGEFTEYRGYRQGDDPRRIDWRLLARSDRAFIRVTDERAWLPTWFVVDASASMAFPARESQVAPAVRRNAPGARVGIPDKWTTVRQLGVALAAVAHAAGDPVGMLVNTRPDTLRLAPITRRGVVQRIARTLDAIDPASHAGTVPTAMLLRTLPPRVRIVVLTDALDDADALASACAQRAASGSAVTVVHVVHPEELTPIDGIWRVQDPDHSTLSRTLTPGAIAEYQRAFGAWRAQVAIRVRAGGAGYVQVECGADTGRTVRNIVAS